MNATFAEELELQASLDSVVRYGMRLLSKWSALMHADVCYAGSCVRRCRNGTLTYARASRRYSISWPFKLGWRTSDSGFRTSASDLVQFFLVGSLTLSDSGAARQRLPREGTLGFPGTALADSDLRPTLTVDYCPEKLSQGPLYYRRSRQCASPLCLHRCSQATAPTRQHDRTHCP